MSEHPTSRVVIVDGARTPFAKAGGALKPYTALDLAVHAVNGLLEKRGLDPQAVDELAFGIVVVDPRIPHMAREVALASRLPASTRAVTITDNCITSLSGIAQVYDAIVAGRAAVGIAGGVESISNAPLLFGRRAATVLMDAAAAKSLPGRVRALLRLRPGDLRPVPPSVKEPSTGLSMGEHCELMVKAWRIGRQEQDAVAYRSHMKAHAATVAGYLPAEIHPLNGLDRDPLIRADTSLEKLAQLPPVFDRSAEGTITAGTSSPLTDGAAAVLLMDEARAQRDGYTPLAYVKAFAFAALDPADGLLMGPALAVPRVLRRAGLTLDDMDIVEVHEAFAGQVLCNLHAWEHGWREPAIGGVAWDRLNPLGGSLAVGHPFAATGARIATTLAHQLQRQGARYGLISICGAGATAGAMILERVEDKGIV
jgi:acetyl-CoA acetyltransferase family protein